jgi:predicted ribosome-associated RNA-binding protein Tma20
MDIESIAKDFCEKHQIQVPVSREDRLKVTLACGYIDARNMVFFKETYGLPLDMMLMQMRKKFPKVKVDYGGLEHELLMIGTNDSAVKSQIAELRIADREMESI